mmetsp:Transcript_11438/g.39017  ORF Transcript_11438/g.39017 Transcript_11438/m.39017 type:complete len:354 (-) Transcript_11438:742-1803(-)
MARPGAASPRGALSSHLVHSHLLGEGLLVVLDGAVVAAHRAVLAHPDLLGHLGDELEVVRDEDHAALEVVDRLREAVHRVRVEAVGGLVEEEDAAGRHGDDGEDEARLLPPREAPDGRVLELRGEAEVGQEGAPYLLRAAHLLRGEGLAHEGQRGQVRLQDVRRVLVVPADGHVRGLLHGALRGGELPGHQFEQRALAAAVRAHERDPRVKVHAEAHVVVEVLLGAARVGEGDGVEGEHRRRHAARLGEAEAQGGLPHLGPRDRRLGHLVEDLLLALGARGHAVGLVLGHKGRQLLHVSLLLLIALHQNGLLVRQHAGEHVVPAAVVGERLVVEADRVRADSIEEIGAAGDDH